MVDICDHVGGVCYEQLPEKYILMWVLIAALVVHILFVGVPIFVELLIEWFKERSDD